MPTYSELLRDPRWQKKRLEILSRDEFACQNCFATEKTLHVHHLHYTKGAMPWEYGNSLLVTLCVDCHDVETQTAYKEKQELLGSLSAKGLLADHFGYLARCVDESDAFPLPIESYLLELGWAIRSPRMRQLIHDEYESEMEHRIAEREAANG